MLTKARDQGLNEQYTNITKIISQKRDEFCNNLVRKFIPMPQAMKIPAAKAAVAPAMPCKNYEKLWEW